MTSAEMYQWMADPSLLTKSSLPDLRQMVDEFPYFHAVRMLYLKNLAVLKDVRLGKELKKMAVYVPDRKQLFMLIEGFDENKQPPAVKQQETGENLHFMDKILSPEVSMKKEGDKRTVPSSNPSPASATDYINWLEANADDLPLGDGTENRLKHQELIDTFIANERKQGGSRLNFPVDKKVERKEDENEKMTVSDAFEKTSLDDSYFTETLARVYASQKRYDKALEIIRVLSLKYPEKNSYFADQIQYLEEIINIKK
ncbi:MAG: hypothetical protein LBL57_07470 [Tannerella sp.]|jgi:hypothetical protein|nr:hypothetical protein [Tannerella sp.]